MSFKTCSHKEKSSKIFKTFIQKLPTSCSFASRFGSFVRPKIFLSLPKDLAAFFLKKKDNDAEADTLWKLFKRARSIRWTNVPSGRNYKARCQKADERSLRLTHAHPRLGHSFKLLKSQPSTSSFNLKQGCSESGSCIALKWWPDSRIKTSFFSL